MKRFGETDYFAEIPDIKIPAEMLKLAEHIVETKADDFKPDEFVDHYEEAVVELLKQKQAGKVIKGNAPAPRGSNVVNLMDALKRSLAESKPTPRKSSVKAPPLAPAMPKARKKQKA